MTIPSIRRVSYETGAELGEGEYISCYTNTFSGWLIPNTELYFGDNLNMKTNSLGCKGDELVQDVPVIGFFGDSGTFGVGLDSWVRRVNVSGTQNLNASVEGHSMQRVVDQYFRLKNEVDFIAGVFYTGWHNIVYNRTDEEYWEEQLDRIQGVDVICHVTPHTCLIEDCLTRGVEELLSDGPEFSWELWHNFLPTIKNVFEIYEGILRFNMFLEAYCERKKRIFIDLDTLMKPKTYESIPKIYWDACHVRPHNYPKMAVHVSQIIQQPITDIISREIELDSPEIRKRNPSNIPKVGLPSKGVGQNIYPLW